MSMTCYLNDSLGLETKHKEEEQKDEVTTGIC